MDPFVLRIPQMSTARGRDRERTKSGGVKTLRRLIPGWLCLTTTLRETISKRRGACSHLSLDLSCLYSIFAFFTAFFDLFFFSLHPEYHMRTAFRCGWRAIVVYVCSAFIWT